MKALVLCLAATLLLTVASVAAGSVPDRCLVLQGDRDRSYEVEVMVRGLATERGLTVRGASSAALEIAEPAGATAQMSSPFEHHAAVIRLSDNSADSQKLQHYLKALASRALEIGLHPLACEDVLGTRDPYSPEDDRRG